VYIEYVCFMFASSCKRGISLTSQLLARDA